MTKKDQIIKLKQKHLKNSDIARLLQVSRGYVSHVCRTSQGVKSQIKSPASQRFVTTGVASDLLGVSQSTIRRWSDQGKLPTFRINIGRRDRRYSVSDLEKAKIANI
jgi:excisionase family DNA binding protein